MNSARATPRRILDAACIGSFVAVSFLAVLAAALAPRDAASGIAVVYAPWTSAEAAFNGVAEAGGRIVRGGGLPFVVIARPDGADFTARVRAAGAWFFADPVRLAACLDPTSGGRAP